MVRSQGLSTQIFCCCLVLGLWGCEPRSQSPLSLPSPSSPTPTPDSRASLPHARLNLSLEPIASAFYELRWNTQPEAYSYRLWLDGKLYKDNLVLPREILDLTGYALGSHTLKLESINARGQVTAVGELRFELQARLPSPTPYPIPSPIPYPIPSPLASVEPFRNTINSVSPTPKRTPRQPDPTPTPFRRCNCEDLELNSFYGKIYDDSFSPLSGVTVEVYSNSQTFNYYDKTEGDVYGQYAFKNVPSSISLTIKASKPGYSERRRVEVVKSRPQGIEGNRFDFGTDGGAATFSAAYNALSDKPEVVMVTPARNGSGVAFNTSFVLKFSEPMDKQTVENNFMIFAFNNRKLTVDADNLRVAGGANTVIGKDLVATNFLPGNSTPIWGKAAFNISWNSDDSEATFSFKEGKQLPTDKDSNLVPNYNVAFRAFSGGDRVLTDKSGISRSDRHFKLTDGDFEESYKFSIKIDEVKPTLTHITPDPQSPRGAGFILHYSEPMLLETLGVNIAGGMSDSLTAFRQAPAGYPGAINCTSAKAAENYLLLVKDALGQTRFEGSWAQLGGRVEYLSRDASRKSVRLTLPAFAGAATDPDVQTRLAQLLSSGQTLSEGVIPSLFEIGERLTFRVEADVMDPAGNTVDSARNNVSLTLNG